MSKLKLLLNIGFIKDVVSSAFPTLFAYFDFLKDKLEERLAILIAIILFIILLLIMFRRTISNFDRGVSRALATAYYHNFVKKLMVLITSRKNEISFFIEAPDGSETKVVKFHPDNIKIRFLRVNSYEELILQTDKMEKENEIAYIDKKDSGKPFFVWAKVENDKLTIVELPRTLFSLKYYLLFEKPNLSRSEIQEKTKKFFDYFDKEFQRLWGEQEIGKYDIDISPSYET